MYFLSSGFFNCLRIANNAKSKLACSIPSTGRKSLQLTMSTRTYSSKQITLQTNALDKQAGSRQFFLLYYQSTRCSIAERSTGYVRLQQVPSIHRQGTIYTRINVFARTICGYSNNYAIVMGDKTVISDASLRLWSYL